VPSPSSPAKPFTLVCGPDDFLVAREGKNRHDALAAGITDEFSRDTISGAAGNVSEVATAINRFRESVQTISMFGDRRLVWLKDVNFLADTQTGRAESTLKLVGDLQEILAANDPAQVAILITASPVDKRRSFYKWCEKNADLVTIGGDGADALATLTTTIMSEAGSLGVTFADGAIELLLAKIGPNTRLLVEETRKLANNLDADETAITEAHVEELTPNVAEGDFFEAAEAFFSGNLRKTLDALHRHFFGGGDARPLVSALQNRNRLLLQLRALVHAGDIKIGARGIDKTTFDKAASPSSYGRHFAGVTEKSSYNLFSQHPYYLGKLATASLPSMRRLIANQQEFIAAFEDLIRRPNEQEEVLREMTLRCLGND
jgi:DNA polymerase-3 subunit delta